MLGHKIGIQIRDEMIDLVEFTSYHQHVRVYKSSHIEVPKGWIEDGRIMHTTGIKTLIEDVLKKNKYKGTHAVCVVQSEQALLRQAKLQGESDKMIRQIIKVKPHYFLPIDPGQYYVDYHLFQVEKDRHVLLVALPRMIVDPIVELMNELQLKIICLTIPEQGITQNILGKQEEFSLMEHSVLMIYLEQQYTQVTFMLHGHACLTRRLSSGFTRLREPIHEALLEARQVFYLNLEQQLIGSLEQFIHFYYETYNAPTLQKIYYLSASDQTEQIVHYIQGALNIPVEVMQPVELGEGYIMNGLYGVLESM